MTHTPTISVIMAAYNHAAYIQRAIESVQAQRYGNWELIITDDGSADNTPEIIRAAAATDTRIKAYFFERNKGACVATAHSFAHCDGDFIAIINSDDTWHPDKLSIQLSYLETHPNVGAVFSRVQTVNEQDAAVEHPLQAVFNTPKNRSRDAWLRHFFVEGNCLCHPSLLIRKHCYADAGGIYRNELAALPDFDMWIRLCFVTDIHILDEPLINFRVLANAANESAVNTPNLVRDTTEKAMVLQNYLRISSPAHFAKIFPEAPAIDDATLIPFQLAQIALAQDSSAHKLFGLNTLYALMRKPDTAATLATTGFNYPDLHRTAKKIDIFGYSVRDLLQKARRKAHNYRKYFIASALLNIALVALLLYFL